MTTREDPHALADRKSDHLELAQKAQLTSRPVDYSLDYEPLFGRHPSADDLFHSFDFLGKKMRLPLWVSSMTGGTNEAGNLNRVLAGGCARFGLGMGLGSCRSVLESDEFFEDFNLRPILGDEVPFFANIGIAQLDELAQKGEFSRLDELVSALRADGLIVHLNPLQEWFQPEGDRFLRPSYEVLKEFLQNKSYPVIVKEVGQGMGPRSLRALSELGVHGLEFGAFGGTNFSRLEALRRTGTPDHWDDFCHVGHSAEEMLTKMLQISNGLKLPALIISGGIRSSLHGASLLARAPKGSVLGLAMPFLKQASKGEESLAEFIISWGEALAMGREFFAPREENR